MIGYVYKPKKRRIFMRRFLFFGVKIKQMFLKRDEKKSFECL